MKKTTWLAGILSVCVFAACKKAATDSVQTSLTASTTQATVGQTVSVSLSSARTAASWTVNPSAAVIKTYDISTSKVNYFTFSQAGTYRIGVRTRDIEYDSVHHQSLDSCWHHGGGDAGHCQNGVDSASVSIKVSN